MNKMRLEAEINSLQNDKAILRERVQKLEAENHYLRMNADEKAKLSVIKYMYEIVNDDEFCNYNTKGEFAGLITYKLCGR